MDVKTKASYIGETIEMYTRFMTHITQGRGYAGKKEKANQDKFHRHISKHGFWNLFVFPIFVTNDHAGLSAITVSAVLKSTTLRRSKVADSYSSKITK